MCEVHLSINSIPITCIGFNICLQLENQHPLTLKMSTIKMKSKTNRLEASLDLQYTYSNANNNLYINHYS